MVALESSSVALLFLTMGVCLVIISMKLAQKWAQTIPLLLANPLCSNLSNCLASQCEPAGMGQAVPLTPSTMPPSCKTPGIKECGCGHLCGLTWAVATLGNVGGLCWQVLGLPASPQPCR